MILSNEGNELYNKFAEYVYDSNYLDSKTKELIAVSCSVMADCIPCIEHHYNNALKSGATPEEITEAAQIAVAVSSGSKRGKYNTLFAKLKKQGE